jgi:uncharacterized SAM-binding protein YcdF (DUF218 family)
MIYLLSKIFTALLLPPGLFVTIAALLAWFARSWVRRGLATFALFLYLLSIHPVADNLLLPFEAPFRHTTLPAKANAVVTLGGGNMRGNPIPLVDESFKRAIYGMAIGKSLDIPVIVSGNGDRGYDEFHALLDSLKALNPILCDEINVSKTPVGHFALIPETRSRDTYENAVLTREMLGKENPTLIVVTSAYHMRRALMLFRHAGVRHLYPAAVNFYIDPSKTSYEIQDYMPSMWALLNSYRAMHEFFGIVKVKLRDFLK